MSLQDEARKHLAMLAPHAKARRTAELVELCADRIDKLETESAALALRVRELEGQATAANSLPENWYSQNLVERFEDMSPRGRLRVSFDHEGDIIVCVVPDPKKPMEYAPSVEFCTTGSGGGKSPHTRQALIALFKAMERDNLENGFRRGERGRGSLAEEQQETA